MERTGSAVIIGGGASGALAAVHLARVTERPTRITVVEPSAAVGLGLAYGTEDWAHLLNIPAHTLSAYPDDPDHFVRWAGRYTEADGESFLPRRLFGSYLNDQIQRHADRIEHRRSLAVDVAPTAAGVTVFLDDGELITADQVVLALGSSPPAWPAGVDPQGPRWVVDPWEPGRLSSLVPDEPVVLVGTGLTAVDVALSLHTAGHRQVVAVSRHGLLPNAHPQDPAAASPSPIESPPFGSSPRELLTWARQVANQSGGWIPFVDALRPWINPLWGSFADVERARLIRHCHRRWEILRHRMAPPVANRIAAMRASGALTVRAVRLGSSETNPSGVTLHLDHGQLLASAVINCTGPTADVRRSGHHLVQRLLATGVARPGPLALGFDTDDEGRLPWTDGRIRVVGPLRRGGLWETTAIPEIRDQAWELARSLSLDEAGAAVTTPTI
jgi:uncharacterized NAD(P)/FAD-binding protein YdhS